MQHRDFTVSQEREDMVRAQVAAFNAGDVAAVVATFSPDARQRFGNRPEVRGRAEIKAGYIAFSSTIDGIHNEITGIWESAGTVIVRLEARCVRLDGSVLHLPSVCMFTEGADGLIDYFQLWADWTPLFATVPAAVIRR